MTKSTDEDDQFSLEAASPYRTKARQRLIGALALIVLMSIVMPIFFHAEPRIPSVQSKPAKAPEPLLSIDQKADTGETGTEATKPVSAADAESSKQASSPVDAVSKSQASSETQGRQLTADTNPTPQPTPTPTSTSASASASASTSASTSTSTSTSTTAAASPDPGNRRSDNPNAERFPDRYVLQAGAFSKKSSARAQVARLKKLGFKVYTEQVKTPKGERTRVRVGPFDDKAEAVQAQKKLRKAKLDVPLAGPDQ